MRERIGGDDVDEPRPEIEVARPGALRERLHDFFVGSLIEHFAPGAELIELAHEAGRQPRRAEHDVL